MNDVIGTIVLIFIAFCVYNIFNYFKEDLNTEEEKLPYKKKDYLFTYSEKTFLNVLNPIAEKHNLHSFGKVRMEDLLYLPKMERKDWLHFRGKVRSRHIDFVLCDKENYTPVIAIELNGSSHESKKQKKVDEFKTKALEDAGLPLLTIKYSKYYNEENLEKKILEVIGPEINKEKEEEIKKE